MTLYFINSFNDERVVTENVADTTAAMQEIQKFLDAYNYKSHYTRYWTRDGVTTFDVGSHTEFFKLKEN